VDRGQYAIRRKLRCAKARLSTMGGEGIKRFFVFFIIEKESANVWNNYVG
jgi:hypothetical protein